MLAWMLRLREHSISDFEEKHAEQRHFPRQETRRAIESMTMTRPVSSSNIKQAALLLIVALLISVTAWAFWRYLGQDADSVLAAILIAGLLLDNIRLRKQGQNGREN